MVQPLDALALAVLPEPVLIKKLASLWCQHYGNSAPTSGGDIYDWAVEEYGPIVKKPRERAIKLALGTEVKAQLAARKRRRQQKAAKDPLSFPIKSEQRRLAIVERMLGAPRRWVGVARTAPAPYSQYCITSGLVAALIHTNFKTRGLDCPTLLVYRQPGDIARSYWVPGSLTTLSDVLLWLIPKEAHQAVRAPGGRVEHDGRRKKARVFFPDGTVKTYAWRKLKEYNR